MFWVVLSLTALRKLVTIPSGKIAKGSVNTLTDVRMG
jgi:hypothetical protein